MHSLSPLPSSARSAAGRPRPTQLELPLRICASPAVRVVRRADGVTELRPHAPQIEGTVQDACRILGGVGKKVVYGLIEEGLIRAYKPAAGGAINRHWRVLMETVWEYKQGLMAHAAEKTNQTDQTASRRRAIYVGGVGGVGGVGL